MIVYCAVPGCSSNSKTTDYTFHRFPSNVILRARWVLAVRRPVGMLGSCPVVCRRHFEANMLSGITGRRKGLARHAVPTLFLPPKQTLPSAPSLEDTGIEETLSLDDDPDNQFEFDNELPVWVESSQHEELPSESVSKEELVACRACLAADGRMYAISDSGLEDTLAALTGVELSAGAGLPGHLCVWCASRLSKCAAFRADCRRSDQLLQTLMKKGTLTLDEIKAVDRQTHKLTHGLAQVKLFQFQTQPVMEVSPLYIKNEDSEKVPSYTEEYLESDDGAEYLYIDDSDDTDVIENVEDIRVDLIEDSDARADVDDKEYILDNCADVDADTLEETRATVTKDSNTDNREINKNAKTISRYPADVDSDMSEETIEIRKRVNKVLKKKKAAGMAKDYPIVESYALFEKQFNCSVKLLSKEEQKRQVDERKRKSTSAFCCDLCGKGFKKIDTLKTHMNCHDPSLPYECDVCFLRYRDRRGLTTHEATHRAVFTCNECGCISRFRTSARLHFLLHKGTQYPCPYCDAVYQHQTSCCNHVRAQHPARHEPCDRCGETFAGPRGLTMHKALAHKTTYKCANLKCRKCDVTFLNAEALQRHQELVADVPHAAQWPCAACGESCGSEHALATHAAEHQKDRHHCDKCNKTFLSSASFELHAQRKHMNKRASSAPFRRREPGAAPAPRAPFVCETCGKTLMNWTLMRYHMNVHLSVKPFQCQLCPKAYSSRLGLSQHEVVHTGERPFKCDQCPQSFRFKSNLVRHVTHIHLQQPKLVSCVACDKVLCASSLALHVRTVHQNQKYVRPKRKRTRAKVHMEP